MQERDLEVMPLTLVVPKVLPEPGPLRVMVDVPHTLLHHFDPSLEADPDLKSFMKKGHHSVSLELARLAMATCLGPDKTLPEIHEAYMSSERNDKWALRVYFDYLIPAGNKNPPVVSFQANEDLDEDGNVEFIPFVPRTEKAREKYNCTAEDPSDDNSEG